MGDLVHHHPLPLLLHCRRLWAVHVGSVEGGEEGRRVESAIDTRATVVRCER